MASVWILVFRRRMGSQSVGTCSSPLVQSAVELWCDGVDPHVDRVTKWQSVRVNCLPGAFVCSIRKWCCEGDLDGSLCACAGGRQGEFFRRVQYSSANMPESIGRIPMAGAAVFDRPLFIYA